MGMPYGISKLEAATLTAIDPPILPDGTQVIRREGWYQIVNPRLKEASANEVMLSRLNPSEVDESVEETVAIYQEHGLPFKWAIGPMSSPDRIEGRLQGWASASPECLAQGGRGRMSLDVSLLGAEGPCLHCGGSGKSRDEIFWSNITHNLTEMAGAAGIYHALWRPEEIGITKAGQLIAPLEAGLARLMAGSSRS